MPKYVKVRGGVVVQYPITEADLSAATGITYPNGATEKDFRNYGCFRVYPQDPDTSQELVRELAPIDGGDGYWYEQWEARPYTPEEVEDYKVKVRNQIIDEQYKRSDTAIDVDGQKIDTDLDALGELTGALDATRRGKRPIRKVNLRSGRVQVNQQQLEGMVDAIDSYRQGCMDRGYDISALVDAATTKTEVDQIMATEFGTGWPVE